MISGTQNSPHSVLANAIRTLAMDAVEKAGSGHPGMPMGMADVATVLFQHFLKFDPSHPLWPNRDRFILSAGHGSMLLYALGYLTGYQGMTLDEIKNFRQLNSHTAGHPEKNFELGIETTTGPLGQGFANAVGMALAERILQGRFGSQLIDHYTYVIAGDGCLMEGITQEALSLAGHLQLSNLIVFFDDNHISIDGSTNLSTSDNQTERFKASRWHVQAIDGHDPAAIYQAIKEAQASPLPSMIACKTTIGYGAPTKAGTATAHGSPLGKEEIEQTRKNLNWPYAPFEIPGEILNQWRDIGKKGLEPYKQWQKNFEKTESSLQDEFKRRFEKILPKTYKEVILNLIKKFTQDRPTLATRQTSGMTLDVLVDVFPELIGGSADLTGSNNTKAKDSKIITTSDFKGNYLHYGVREHAMVSIMNGLNLHGGLIPYGGTFLVFSDYCRPSIRLAALMKLPIILVLTHDSIGLGEDGPTHQPIEHLASLRVIPNLNVFRPADAVETAECWMAALESKETPSVLALTRQKVPAVRTVYTDKNLSEKGAYILKQPSQLPTAVTLLATGSEVHIALEVAQKLEERKINTKVVSMPCWRLFDKQPHAYRQELLDKKSLKVAIEAASPFGWERYTGKDGLIFGLNTFGASAPYEALYEHFNLTVKRITENILSYYHDERGHDGIKSCN
jgi:transketolase